MELISGEDESVVLSPLESYGIIPIASSCIS